MASQLVKFRSSQPTNDPVLKKDELGFDLDKNILKIGNGKSKWSELGPAISLSLNDGYNGELEIIEEATGLEEEVVAAVKFQGNVLAELSPGQKAVLVTAGQLVQNNIEVITNKNLDVYVPLWDGSYTSEEGVVSAQYKGEIIKGEM